MQNKLRKWHRWIGLPATLFLILASTTGIWLAGVEFFGEEEALREQTRDLVSPVSTLTADASALASLAQARAAVLARLGEVPVDSIAWQFKGGKPTITFYIGGAKGGEDKKVTCDAHDGRVLRLEDYADKSFIRRLHSGEAFGDGGLVLAMLWGLALLALSVSGIIIYFKMRRRNAVGLRKVIWTVALYAAVRPDAKADSPFYTDDPNFSPGWEIKIGATTEHNSGGSNLTEVLDWNYAILPQVRLNLTTYTKDVWPDHGGHEFGYGDTEFKVKWRFQDEDAKSGAWAWGIAPKVFIPTAEEARGLGDGVWRLQLPLQFGKTMGPWYHFGEVGYQWALDSEASDSLYGGLGTLYNFSPHWALGTELFSVIPMDHTDAWQLLTTLGLVYTFNEHWAVKTSLSQTLRDTNRGGPAPSAVLYAVWNF